MKKVAIVPHLEKPEVASSSRELVKWLSGRNIEACIPYSDAIQLKENKLACADNEISQAELVVVLGGDGTILRAARLLEGAQVPVLGVNMGQLGFLSEVRIDDLYPALENIIQGKFEIDRRMMIEGAIFSRGKSIQKITALNEIVVERGPQRRLLKLSVSINNSLLNNYSVDGLIFSTPTGSTAYSLSAGGPIVTPGNRLILMTPVCPHGLFKQTLVLPESDEINAESLGPDEIQVTISADGVVFLTEQSIKSIQVRASQLTTSLVRVTRKSFFDVLRQKLKL